jgi:AraC-like DNA-binding protein
MQQELGLPATASGWVWLHRPPSRMRRSHHHHEVELNLLSAGRACCLVDGRRCELAAGDLLWLHPHHEHLLLEETPEVRLWVAVWRPACLPPKLVLPTDAQPRRLTAAETLDLARLFALVQSALDSDAAHDGLSFLLRRAVSFGGAAAPAAEQVHPVVRAALLHLAQDPGCDAGQLAALVGLGADQLGRLFRRELGTGIVACRDRLRLQRILSTARPGQALLPAAQDAGFASYSAFQRACRRIYGCPPSRLLADEEPAAYKARQRAGGRLVTRRKTAAKAAAST